jgi:DNA repair protein RadD
LHVRGGEFVAGEVESLFGDAAKVWTACGEAVQACRGRRSVLVFCASVSHAESVAEAIRKLTGEDVGVVVGATDPLERATAIACFRSGRLRWLVGVDVLTTGFDAPNVDAVVVLRATMSSGLFYQMAGRGFRPAEGKADCLLLDYGNNLDRHGPLDSPDYGRKRGGHGDVTGEAPTKCCPNCNETLHAAAVSCQYCGFAFPARELKHDERADTASDIYAKAIAPQAWRVLSWTASRHSKKKQKARPDDCSWCERDTDRPCEICGWKPTPPTLRIDYACIPQELAEQGVGGNLATETVSEWVCLEHNGFAGANAKRWWGAHSNTAVPDTVIEAVEQFNVGACGRPTAITTKEEKGFRRVIGREGIAKPAIETISVGDAFEGEAVGEKWGAIDDDVPF